jgi:hypothetical protein
MELLLFGPIFPFIFITLFCFALHPSAAFPWQMLMQRGCSIGCQESDDHKSGED